jgi:Holliday junction resolvase
MEKKSEKDIQKEIIEYLEDKGYYVIKIVRANKSGVADLAVCYDGKFVAIEVKAEGKKHSGLTHLQKHHLYLVTQSGGKAFVADSVWDVMEELG